MEVRYARSPGQDANNEAQQTGRQLFFAHAPASATEASISELFSRFSRVVEVKLLMDKRTSLSRGCGFVTMGSHMEAAQAIDTLSGSFALGPSDNPLLVRWAETEQLHRQRRAFEEAEVEQRMLFFARVLRSAKEDEVEALFSKFGVVQEVNLFRAFQGAPNGRGCGLITMSSNQECLDAMAALDGKHVWVGMSVPMVVKQMDAQLQRRRREDYLNAMRLGLLPSMGSGTAELRPVSAVKAQQPWALDGSSGGLPDKSNPLAQPLAGVGPGDTQQAASIAAYGSLATQGWNSQTLLPHVWRSGSVAGSGAGAGARGGAEALIAAATGTPMEMPPPGCDPDAIKLFIGNVPRSFGEEDLQPLFEPYGCVVELVIIRDRLGHSKCSALLWFATRRSALQAVQHLNNKLVVQDGPLDMLRTLAVRPAYARRGFTPFAAASLDPSNPAATALEKRWQGELGAAEGLEASGEEAQPVLLADTISQLHRALASQQQQQQPQKPSALGQMGIQHALDTQPQPQQLPQQQPHVLLRSLVEGALLPGVGVRPPGPSWQAGHLADSAQYVPAAGGELPAQLYVQDDGSPHHLAASNLLLAPDVAAVLGHAAADAPDMALPSADALPWPAELAGLQQQLRTAALASPLAPSAAAKPPGLAARGVLLDGAAAVPSVAAATGEPGGRPIELPLPWSNSSNDMPARAGNGAAAALSQPEHGAAAAAGCFALPSKPPPQQQAAAQAALRSAGSPTRSVSASAPLMPF